jgi:TolA-binding protein
MRKAIMLAVGVLAMAGLTPAAHAQSALDARVDQIDKRLRTVERVVSRQTGGTTGMVQPEIAPSEAPVDSTGTPATAPLTDLQSRVAAVEGQVAGLTGRIETAEHRLTQLQDSFDAYKRATDARLAALEGGGAAAAGSPDGDGAAPPPASRPVAGPIKPAADPGRAQRLAAVAKPKTADTGEDAYTYGYRLWQAKLFPEAEAQLAGFAGKYPGHARISRAQNLLGMAYLDDSKPNLAAQIFYENYSKYPDGERAADSLLNLAKTLVVLKKPATEVCRVYTEASKSYGTSLNALQRATLDKGRADNKCK